ncbi:MAG: hypothetical protein IKC32_06685 [Clostridia bacterium]|nr:hypothetical protein [Clostridia bacterium]
MNDIIKLILTVIIVWIGFNFLTWFIKRTALIFKLLGLKKSCNAKVSLLSFPYRPMWLVREGADARVEIMNTVYLIRFYSGGGISKSVHFANESYSCIYMRLKGLRGVRGMGRSSLAMSSGINLYAKVVYTPPFPIPEEYSESEKHIVRALILNPAPGMLSYVTEEKTSIKIAFTGDELYGIKVFTASTFERYAERMMREEQRLLREARGEYDYFFG